MRRAKNLWCERCYIFKEKNVLDDLDPLIVRGNDFCDFVYKTFDNWWKNKENDDDAGQLFLASLDRLTKEKNELHGKINQLLPSQNTVKGNNELSDKIDQHQRLINSLMVSKWALEDNCPKSSL